MNILKHLTLLKDLFKGCGELQPLMPPVNEIPPPAPVGSMRERLERLTKATKKFSEATDKRCEMLIRLEKARKQHTRNARRRMK